MMRRRWLLAAVIMAALLSFACTPPAPATPTPPGPPTGELIELSWDDGVPNGLVEVEEGRALLVRFIPPATPFNLNTVLIHGRLYGTGNEDRMLTVDIQEKGKDYSISIGVPYISFSETAGWISLPFYMGEMNDEFYVVIAMENGPDGGVAISYDNVTPNYNSKLLFDGKYDWYMTNLDKNKTNWMVRVQGAVV